VRAKRRSPGGNVIDRAAEIARAPQQQLGLTEVLGGGVAPSTAAGLVEAASAALARGPFVRISGAISHGMIAHFGA
jgi:hypothetical protein